MSKKKWYSRVFALAIALALSLSLVGGATVSADPDTEWWEEWQPEVNGPDWVIAPNSAIYDFAADPAGDIIYAVGMGVEVQRDTYTGGAFNGSIAHLWKSEDGAITWSDITDELPDSFFDAGEDLYYVAIAPDNSDMVFVATETEVYGSEDAGDDFGDSDFGLQSEGESILCLAVSCESDDDYTVAVGTDGGEVWELVTGGFLSGAWEMIGGYDGPEAVYPGWDDSDVDGEGSLMTTEAVTSIAFSPNFDVDDTILIITTDGVVATYLQTGRLGNVEQWNYIAGSAFPDAVEIVDVPPLWIGTPPGWLRGIVVGGATGIAVSADYDGRKGSLRYTWVYVDYYDSDLGENVGRVFEIDNDDVDHACDLDEFFPMLASISAYGTEEEGKLMVGLLGDYDTGLATDCGEGVGVYYTFMPIEACCPDWESTDKAPTGQEWAIVAYVSDGDKAYAATMGEGRADEGAFSISEIEEAGLYWNQYSLIDTDIDYLSDVASVEDTWWSGQYFLVSVNLWGCSEPAQVCESDSVWYSEDWGEHYIRVWCGDFTNDTGLNGNVTSQIGFIRTSPDESLWVETLYLVDRGTETIWWNDSTGLTDWSDQSTCPLETISDLAAADSSTIYAVSAVGGAEVAKSTDNGESWDDPVDADMGSREPGHTIAVEGNDVLVGSTWGSVSYSDDGGDSFGILGYSGGGAAGSGDVHLAFDAFYGENDTVYSADSAGGGIRRWVIGSSSSFEKLDAFPTLNQMGGDGDDEEDVAYYGIASSAGSNMTDAEDGGVLYAAYAYNDGTDYYTGVARSLTPAADLCCGEADWDYLHAELTTGEITSCDSNWGWPTYPQQFTTEPSSLRVSGRPGYIYLNAIDNLAVYADDLIDCFKYGCYYGYDYWYPLGALWGYEDCFAEGEGVSLGAPIQGTLIPSDPCFCWNEKFVLEWEQPCDGCYYEVQIALDEDFNDIYFEELHYDPPSARNPSLIIMDGELDCSTTYYWRVRAVEADTGEVARSWWSVAWDFAVEAGPEGAIELTSPDNGVTNVPVTGLVFIWTSVDGAVTYDFSLMDASGTEVDSQTGLYGTSYAYAGTLSLDTAYTWQVTAMKGTGMSKADTVSQSQIYTFRTVGAAVFTCAQCGLPFATEAALEVHIADAHPVPEPTTPSWVWVIIGIGAVLVITVIVLIFRTRRV